MRGFQTQTKRKARATGYAGGGMVRGPGTGISDDVPDQVPEGTYIMPADSTAQLGPDKLAGMGARGFKAGGKKAAGGKSVPVNLSNGEFKMPPEQVHAVGVQALEQMKNATHTPAAKQAGEPEMFFANGGAVFGSRGLEGLKAMIPKVAAMGFPQKQAAPVAPAAPVQGSRNVADLKAMIPQMEAMGYKQNPQYLADGGQVRREEGGGLSKEAVMAAIAKQAAQQQPAQPAQQPAARGFSRPATDFLRNPGGILAQRERQAGGYADGGMVDEERQRLANQTAMYVRGAQEAAANRPPEPAAPKPAAPAADTQSGQAAFGVFPQLGRNSAGTPAQTATPQAAAPVPATQVEGWRTKAVMDGAAEDAQAAWGRGGAEGIAGAAGAVARGAITAVPTAIGEFAYNTVAPLASTAKGFWNGLTGSGDNAPGVAQAPIATPAVPRTAAQAAVPTTAQQAIMPAQQPGAQTPQPAMQAPNAGAGQVTRVGNSYAGTNVSGDITVNGQAPRGGFMVADGPRGFSPGAPTTVAPQGVTAPTVLNSSNSWQARNDLRNLEVSASSITNNGGRFDQTKGRNPAQAAYLSALQADAAARGAQPGLDAVAMRENAGIQREGMQQDGATTRTGMTEQGANTREAGRNALATGELGLRREAQGFQTRAAQQQEQLRNVLLDPKSTPQQRAVAQRNLAALSGKTAADRMQTVALPDTTNEMGQVVRGGQALVRVLEDGSVQQVPIGAQQGAALPPGMKRQIGTSNGRPVYEDMNGKQVIAKG